MHALDGDSPSSTLRACCACMQVSSRSRKHAVLGREREEKAHLRSRHTASRPAAPPAAAA